MTFRLRVKERIISSKQHLAGVKTYQFFFFSYIYIYTAWCSEIGSLTSLDTPELHAPVTSGNQLHCTGLYFSTNAADDYSHINLSCIFLHSNWTNYVIARGTMIKGSSRLSIARLLLLLLSYQENYRWVPIQPHTLAKESLTGYNSLL